MRKSVMMLTILLAGVSWLWVNQKTEAPPRPMRIVARPPMENIAHERLEALTTLNEIRSTLGMSSLQENATLQQAAQAHAEYLVRHRLFTHFEESTRRGFTGSAPMDRALQVGYKARFVGENLSTKSRNGLESLYGLFSAIYHRFGFLNPSFDEVGIGIAQDKKDPRNTAFVYLMGNSEIARLCSTRSFHGTGRYVYGVCADTQHRIDAQAYDRARNAIKEGNPKIVIYPYDGQTEVSPVFYQETPDPLPGYDVSGFPVSVEFNDRFFRTVTLVSFELFEKGGEKVASVRLLTKRTDPNHKLTRHQFALLPLKRLKYGTTYRVKLVYRNKSKTYTLTWHFTTIQPKETLKTIREKETTLTLKAGEGVWLYFEPNNPHDVLGTMQYPENVYVWFMDRNTIRLVLDPRRTQGFEIKGSGRRVQIRVAR